MQALLVLFSLTVALAPLPLGANRDWAWSPLAALVGAWLVGLAVILWGNHNGQRKIFASFRSLLAPGILFALVISWGMIQLSGWTPADWATTLSGSAVLGGDSPHSVAFDSERQWMALMRLLTYGGVFVLASVLAERAADARQILGTIVVVATLMTAYSMAAETINSQANVTNFSMWIPHASYFTGTFVNPNHYGTYAGVSALTALALAFRPAGRADSKETRGERWRRRISALSDMGGVWFAMALVLLMGVVLSASRGAAIGFTLALATFTAFYSRGISRIAVVVTVLLVMLVVVFVSPGGEKLVQRTAGLITAGDSGREAVYAMVLDAIALRPMVGWGMGSFSQIFGLFQPPADPAYFYNAHNTYLEVAFDLGIPAACAVVLAITWIVWRCGVGFATRARNRELAGLGVFVAVLVGFHALVDFSLEIPAFTCTYMTVLGTAWAQSWSSRRE